MKLNCAGQSSQDFPDITVRVEEVYDLQSNDNYWRKLLIAATISLSIIVLLIIVFKLSF